MRKNSFSMPPQIPKTWKRKDRLWGSGVLTSPFTDREGKVRKRNSHIQGHQAAEELPRTQQSNSKGPEVGTK